MERDKEEGRDEKWEVDPRWDGGGRGLRQRMEKGSKVGWREMKNGKGIQGRMEEEKTAQGQ